MAHTSEKIAPAPRWRINLKRWNRKIFWTIIGMLALELCLIIPFLTLIGIADPNTYRTKLWEDGYLNGFNSSPDEPLYAAANHRPSKIPLVWSQSVTTFNLVISILATFVLILKIVLIPFHFLGPMVSFIIHGTEVGLFSYSLYAQSSPDTLDPKHINNGLPWYVTKSCDVAAKKSNVGSCQMAKATYYLTVVMLALYGIYLLIALYSMFFAPKPGHTDQETNFMTKHFPTFGEAEQTYDFQPNTPMPYTPRTPYTGNPWGQNINHELDRIPPTPGTTGGMKSPFYAPHAGYATEEAAAEREGRDTTDAKGNRGVSMFGFSHGGGEIGQAVSLPPVTPRTKAFNALEGHSAAKPGKSSLKAEWGKREQGNLPWSGRNSGGRNSGGRYSGGSFK